MPVSIHHTAIVRVGALIGEGSDVWRSDEAATYPGSWEKYTLKNDQCERLL